jgi:hypothetical protein
VVVQEGRIEAPQAGKISFECVSEREKKSGPADSQRHGDQGRRIFSTRQWKTPSTFMCANSALRLQVFIIVHRHFLLLTTLIRHEYHNSRNVVFCHKHSISSFMKHNHVNKNHSSDTTTNHLRRDPGHTISRQQNSNRWNTEAVQQSTDNSNLLRSMVARACYPWVQ